MSLARVGSPRSQKSSTVSKLRDGGVAALAVVLIIVIFEGALRVTGVHFQASFYTREQERGFAFRPFAQGWNVGEEQSYAKINSQGYHDREHEVAKAPGVVRIAVVGSSYVAGMIVPYEQNFVEVIERQLNERRTRKVELFNFGVEAYSDMQSYETLQRDVWKYRPDLVIFAITYLDPLEAWRGSAVNKTFDYRPYFEVDPEGKVVPDEKTRFAVHLKREQVWAEGKRNDWINRSQLATAIRGLWMRAADKLQNVRPRGPGVSPQVPVEPASRILGTLLENLKRDARKNEAELWILAMPMPEQDDPDGKVRESAQRDFEAGTNHHSYFFDGRVVSFAQEHRVPYLILSPFLGAYAEEHQVYLHSDTTTRPGAGHWNQLGNRVAGEYVADRLAADSQKLSLQQSPAKAGNSRPRVSEPGGNGYNRPAIRPK